MTSIRQAPCATLLLIFAAGALCRCGVGQEVERPSLVSRFANDLDPERPMPEYPRPRLARDRWQNLNGRWEYAIRSKEELDPPKTWDGRITVPFCPESQLSGVRKQVGPENRLWYRTRFTVPKEWRDESVLLHFGAVDWETTIWVNGEKFPTTHRGGYDPFTFGISDAARSANGEIELIVSVWDPSDTGSQPRGKQVRRPHGIWYTPVTGIWQTVWIEAVPSVHIQSVDIVPDVDSDSARITVKSWQTTRTVDPVIEVRDGDRVFRPDAIRSTAVPAESQPNRSFVTSVATVPQLTKRWSPNDPHLYDVSVSLSTTEPAVVPPGRDRTSDAVTSYFGMRKIHFAKDADGVNRLFLNNKALFQYGPLDQGWWPDGLYTAPTDEALKYDIEVTKRLGFNMARKHVKVEPQRWYYWCDKLGLLVWQDMPSGMADGRPQGIPPGSRQDAEFTESEHKRFKSELQAMIDANRNHPCIVVWVPFNEGWGQHRTNEILKWVKEYDPTRLVGGPSGWEDRGYGDLLDMHRYPGPGMFPTVDDRVSVLGEFGGLGLPLEGHTWLGKDNWGYRTYTTREELQMNYERLLRQVPALIADGLAAAVYTQTTDVEIEVNGLMTYDRKVIKFDEKRLQELHAPLYRKPGRRVTLVPMSDKEPQQWRYTTDKPVDGWTAPSFDDSAWKSGPGGFGTEGTPNTTVRTVWNTNDIWIRRSFEIANPPSETLVLRIYHDEDAEVYLNGELVARTQGYVTTPAIIPIDGSLKSGRNHLAVHCRQTGGGQYIDVGIDVLRKD